MIFSETPIMLIHNFFSHENEINVWLDSPAVPGMKSGYLISRDQGVLPTIPPKLMKTRQLPSVTNGGDKRPVQFLNNRLAVHMNIY